MSHPSLPEIFSAFSRLKVLILGDVMIDSYLWGKVDRISPEAPVPIMHVQQRESRLGGAANVALNVQALGAEPVLCSVIGEDKDGFEFIELLKKNQLTAAGIIQSPERITTVKHRIIAGSQHLLRVDSEIDTSVSASDEQAFIERARQLIPGCDVIIFEDYDKGVLTQTSIAEIISVARQHSIPTVVDPKKRNFLHYRRATLFKPNLKELREGLKIDFDSNNPEELTRAVETLRERLQVDAALITLSEKGVYIESAAGKHLIPAHVRQIADVSGAGDTVVSIAALCQAMQLPLPLIAGLANLGGGLVCEHVGVVPVQKESLLREALASHLLEVYADN
jgi:D-glycero-beta-D-manno-heptose-7-phosphate kinase